VPLLESRQIRHFLAAFDAGTFGGAAEILGLSQQAVSKSIAALEAQLGVRLFERDGRRVRPTSYAELLLPHARTIAAETDRFRADLSDVLGGRRGRLRIGVGPSAAGEVVARAVKMMAADRRQVRLMALAGTYDMMLNDLLLGKLDAVVSIRQTDRKDPLILEEEIGHIRYMVVAGADHVLAGKAGLSLADLAGERWLAGSNMGAVEQVIEQSFRDAGIAPPTAEIDSTSVIFSLAMLDGGEHLAILPEMLLQRDLDIGRFVRIDVGTQEWSRPLVAATRVRGAKPPLVADFLGSLGRLLNEAK
jgi:DNA-binding transcriptional LysR family regulator